MYKCDYFKVRYFKLNGKNNKEIEKILLASSAIPVKFNGIFYNDLDVVEKIICLTNDFFTITRRKWNTSELILLKSTFSKVGIDIKSDITPKKFFEHLSQKPALIDRLFQDISLEGIYNIEELHAPLVKGMEKIKKLRHEEHYLN